MCVKLYRCFVRNWWINNSDWPDGLEPGPGPSRFLAWASTIDEAQRICKAYNADHSPGRLSRKAEFEVNRRVLR